MKKIIITSSLFLLFLTGCGGSKKKEVTEDIPKDTAAIQQESTTYSSTFTEESTSIHEESSTMTEATIKEEPVKKENTSFSDKQIDLKSESDLQFSGANIKPLNAKIDSKGILKFSFDWRNDWGGGSNDSSSFNGAMVSIKAFQDDQELESNYDKMLNSHDPNLYHKSKKNVTTTIDYEFELINPNSDVTIVISGQDADDGSFSFEIK